ncbi:MAG TPA: hypothetical protein VNX86_15185 [Rhizomicrobium sp.]|jgi:hypothetical protein|nr:hypothetical protein [Rhizomicrobium sp.]
MAEQDTGKNGKDRKNGERDKRKFWPTLVDAIASYAAYNRAKAQQPNDPFSRKIARWTFVTGIGTILAAVLAGVAAYVFWRQLGTMQDQLDAARAEQRPWMVAQPAGEDCHMQLSDDGNITCTVTLSNIGKSPALEMRHKVTGGGYPYPLPRGISLPIPTERDVAATPAKTVLPNIPVFDHWQTVDKFTPEAFSQVAQPTTVRMYVFGRIDYVDGFGAHQCTIFCMSWSGDQSHRMEYCPRYNSVCVNGHPQ